MKVTFCNIRTALLLLAGAIWLAGCSPELNWREMPAADGALRVAFPAKPRSDVRQLPAGEHVLDFHLTAASAGGGIFAVGHARLPPGLAPAQRDALREALEASLAANLQAGRVERRQAQVRHVAGAARGTVAVDELEIHGSAAGEPAWVLAQVFVLGERIVEVAAIGPEDGLPREAARSFLDSLRIQ